MCEYVAVCVDNLAFAMKDQATFAKTLEDKHNFKLKGTGELSFHLGANFIGDKDGTLMMSPAKCITERFVLSCVKMFGSCMLQIDDATFGRMCGVHGVP